MSRLSGGGFNIGGNRNPRPGARTPKKVTRKHVRKGASSARKTARPIKKKDEKRGKKKK